MYQRIIAMIKSRKQFYKSKEWRKVRELVIIRQGGICNRCNKPVEEIHHIIPLTDENYTDPSISLNLDNLEGLCHDCHNEETNPIISIRDDIKFDSYGNLIQKQSKY